MEFDTDDENDKRQGRASSSMWLVHADCTDIRLNSVQMHAQNGRTLLLFDQPRRKDSVQRSTKCPQIEALDSLFSTFDDAKSVCFAQIDEPQSWDEINSIYLAEDPDAALVKWRKMAPFLIDFPIVSTLTIQKLPQREIEALSSRVLWDKTSTLDTLLLKTQYGLALQDDLLTAREMTYTEAKAFLNYPQRRAYRAWSTLKMTPIKSADTALKGKTSQKVLSIDERKRKKAIATQRARGEREVLIKSWADEGYLPSDCQDRSKKDDARLWARVARAMIASHTRVEHANRILSNLKSMRL